MDDYSRATDAGRAVEIDGRHFFVSKFTPRDMGDLQSHLREVIPSPRAQFKGLAEGASDEVAKQIWRDLNDEHQSWPPSFGSPEGNRVLLYTSEGNARLLWVTLRRHNKGIDLDRARELAAVIDLDTLNRVVALALPEYAHDPKARMTTGTGTGTEEGPAPA